jgi:hypothetical protein
MEAAPAPIAVNRAPVLTLWATVVAERLGYPPDTALTLGRFVAGSSARAKARRLGIADHAQEAEERRVRAAELKPKVETVRLLGREVRVLAALIRSPCRRPRSAVLRLLQTALPSIAVLP